MLRNENKSEFSYVVSSGEEIIVATLLREAGSVLNIIFKAEQWGGVSSRCFI